MKQSHPKIQDSKHASLFETPSMLPVTSKSNFEVKDLSIKVVFDCESKKTHWTKEYLVEKTDDNNPENDQWFEMTDCPEGEFVHAKRDESFGYGQEAYLDSKENIMYRIDLREKLSIGDRRKIIVSFVTENHEGQDKLLEMESSPYFKKYLFRYDFGYSVPVNRFTYQIEVKNGSIINAWPRGNGLSKLEDNIKATYMKSDGLRPREIFNTLVQIEYGSRAKSAIYKNRGAALIGVLTSLVASGIFYLITVEI